MEVDDGNPATFYNLIMRYSENKEAHTPFILKYTMSDAFLPQYQATGSLQGFEGTVQKILIKGNTTGSNRRGNAAIDPGGLSLGDPCPSTTSVGGSPGGGINPDPNNPSITFECTTYVVTTTWYSQACSPSGCADPIVIGQEESLQTECDWTTDGEAVGAEDDCGPDMGEIPIIIEIPEPLDLVLGNTNLSPADLQKLKDALNELLLENCIFLRAFNHLTSNNVKLDFMIDSSFGGTGSYDPNSKTIRFPYSSSITPGVLREELYHAYQDTYYANGISPYAGTTGFSNIEFEAKFMIDLARTLYGYDCCAVFPGDTPSKQEFQFWLLDNVIGQGSTIRDFASFKDGYFNWIERFKAENPAYNYPTDPDLIPSAMLNLFSSPCN